MNKINKNIKIYFLDLDGTLLDAKVSRGNFGVSDINREAIKQAKKDGKHIVISTGRTGQFVLNLMKDLDIEYAVVANGAMVVNKKGKIIKNDPLEVKQFLLLLDIIKENNLCMKLDGDLVAYGINNWFSKRMAENFGFVPNDHYNCDMLVPHQKVVIWGKSKSKMKKMKELIVKNVSELSVESSAHGWTLEITNEKSTKGLGNLFVADKLGIDKKNIIHVGDTMNDSTAAKSMKLIAMKNATKELKNIASHLGPNWKNGGVAKVLNGEYIKNEKK